MSIDADAEESLFLGEDGDIHDIVAKVSAQDGGGVFEVVLARGDADDGILSGEDEATILEPFGGANSEGIGKLGEELAEVFGAEAPESDIGDGEGFRSGIEFDGVAPFGNVSGEESVGEFSVVGFGRCRFPVPESDGIVLGTGDEPIGIGNEAEGADGVGVSAHGCNRLSALGVPESNEFVFAGGGDDRLIGREFGGGGPAGVTEEEMFEFSFGDIPDADGSIISGGDKEFSVGREFERVDGAGGVSCQFADELSLGDVPELDDGVFAGCGGDAGSDESGGEGGDAPVVGADHFGILVGGIPEVPPAEVPEIGFVRLRDISTEDAEHGFEVIGIPGFAGALHVVEIGLLEEEFCTFDGEFLVFEGDLVIAAGLGEGGGDATVLPEGYGEQGDEQEERGGGGEGEVGIAAAEFPEVGEGRIAAGANGVAIEETMEIVGKLFGGGVAFDGIELHTFEADGLQLAGDRGIDAARRCELGFGNFGEDGEIVFAGESGAPDEEFIEQRAKGEDVGARSDIIDLAARLFGGEVGGCSHDFPGAGESR